MAENLSFPTDIKPFRARTKEAWASFLAGEGELRALMDQKGGDAARERLIERCSALLDRWNILVGRTRSRSFGLRVYCEKLLSLKKENENQVYSILYILLDQALGELAAMRYVDGLEILNAPGAGAGIRLDRLAEYVAAEIDPEGWASSGDLEAVCGR